MKAMAAPVTGDLEHEITELYNVCAAELLRFACTFTCESQAAHDAVQEAFVRYFIERRYGRAITHPRPWLYQTVRNYMLDRMKSAAVRQEVAVEQAESLPGCERDPQARVEGSETAREIAAELTTRELECLRLRSRGLTYDEIGQTLVISSGTVAAVLARVHAKLRALGHGTKRCSLAGAREALRLLMLEGLPETP